MDIKTGKIEIKDGSKIAYRMHGKSTNPMLIFVSGSIFNYKQFDYSLFPSLLKHLQKEYSFLFYDYIGIGESSQINGEFNFLEITRQHIELLDALNISEAHHFGYSKGALISYLAAGGYPNRVKSIGSYGTPNLAYTSDKTTKQEYSKRLQYLNSINGIWEQLIDKKNYKIIYDAVFLPTIFHGKQSSNLGIFENIKNWWIRKKLRPLLEGTLIYNIVKLYQLYKKDISEEDRKKYIEAMEKLEIPTLLMHSNQDEILPIENSNNLHKLVKRSQLVKFDKFTHASPVLLKKQGSQIMKSYAKFLNEITD